MNVILPLFYLPNIHYFSVISRNKSIILDNREIYQKGSFRNSSILLGPNGPQKIIVPVKKHKLKAYKELEIAYDMPWHLQHVKSIQTAYSNAPFYEYYADGILEILKEKEKSLWELNTQLLMRCLKWLHLEPDIQMLTQVENLTDPHGKAINDLHQSYEGIEFEIHHQKPYAQVFEYKFGFVPHLSILDLLMCCGPSATRYL